jgi:hypothetical protein
MSSVFQDYFTDEKPPQNLIRTWYLSQDARVRAAFDARVAFIESFSNVDWKRLNPIKPLERDCAGLWEVLIDLKDRRPFRQIRPIGVWHSDEKIFVLLGAFEKSGRIHTPANACSEALKYKAQYQARRGEIHDHF